MQTSLYERFMAVGSVKSLLTGEVYTTESDRKAPETESPKSDSAPQKNPVRSFFADAADSRAASR